jgi:hypothetical protein
MENIDSWSSHMQNGHPTSNMSRPSPRRASPTTVIGNSLPNAARETSSATATVATAAAAQCVLHHRKQRHASAHPQLFLDSVASYNKMWGPTVGSWSGHICNLMTCRLFLVPHCYLVVLIPNGEVS